VPGLVLYPWHRNYAHLDARKQPWRGETFKEELKRKEREWTAAYFKREFKRLKFNREHYELEHKRWVKEMEPYIAPKRVILEPKASISERTSGFPPAGWRTFGAPHRDNVETYFRRQGYNTKPGTYTYLDAKTGMPVHHTDRWHANKMREVIDIMNATNEILKEHFDMKPIENARHALAVQVEESQAALDGAVAFDEGVNRDSTPYYFSSHKNVSWQRGWDRAMKEQQELANKRLDELAAEVREKEAMAARAKAYERGKRDYDRSFLREDPPSDYAPKTIGDTSGLLEAWRQGWDNAQKKANTVTFSKGKSDLSHDRDGVYYIQRTRGEDVCYQKIVVYDSEELRDDILAYLQTIYPVQQMEKKRMECDNLLVEEDDECCDECGEQKRHHASGDGCAEDNCTCGLDCGVGTI